MILPKPCRRCGCTNVEYSPKKRSTDGFNHICKACVGKALSKAMTGLKRTNEHRENISRSKKGKPLSEAARAAICRAAAKTRGVPLSEEHRAAISRGNKGRKCPERAKKIISEKARKRHGSDKIPKEEYPLYRRARLYKISYWELREKVDKFEGLCWVCKAKPFAHVDHCHETGKVRGVLCGTCNTGLGKLGDNLASLRRAVAYLERFEK